MAVYYSVFSYSRYLARTVQIGYPYYMSAATPHYLSSEEVLKPFDTFYYHRKPWKLFDYRLTGHLLVEMGNEISKQEPAFVIEWDNGSFISVDGNKPPILFLRNSTFINRRKRWKEHSPAYNRAVVTSYGGRNIERGENVQSV